MDILTTQKNIYNQFETDEERKEYIIDLLHFYNSLSYKTEQITLCNSYWSSILLYKYKMIVK